MTTRVAGRIARRGARRDGRYQVMRRRSWRRETGGTVSSAETGLWVAVQQRTDTGALAHPGVLGDSASNTCFRATFYYPSSSPQSFDSAFGFRRQESASSSKSSLARYGWNFSNERVASSGAILADEDVRKALNASATSSCSWEVSTKPSCVSTEKPRARRARASVVVVAVPAHVASVHAPSPRDTMRCR